MRKRVHKRAELSAQEPQPAALLCWGLTYLVEMLVPFSLARSELFLNTCLC